MAKWVYLFKEGNADMRNLLGGKGANLAEMTNLGMPIPQGFTVTTEACTDYYTSGKQITEEIQGQIFEALKWLEEENPTITEYKKILKLTNKPYDSKRLQNLLDKLESICFYHENKKSDFRNRQKLLDILCEDCESLKNFYEELKNDNQKRTDLL